LEAKCDSARSNFICRGVNGYSIKALGWAGTLDADRRLPVAVFMSAVPHRASTPPLVAPPSDERRLRDRRAGMLDLKAIATTPPRPVSEVHRRLPHQRDVPMRGGATSSTTCW
jgi:hypothetical protein